MWDPHFYKDINELEKVPRRAVRWTMSDFSWSSSVTYMLELLQRPTLCNRRYIWILHMFYKSVYHLTAVQLPPYFLRNQQSTRQYHPLHFIVPSTNCDYYKYSFFQEQLETGTIYHMTWLKVTISHYLKLSCKQSFDSELILIAYIIVECLKYSLRALSYS